MPTNTFTGNKSCGFGDGFGVCPNRQKSIQRLFGRLNTIDRTGRPDTETRVFEVTNAGHSYLLEVRWVNGAVQRFGFRKPTSKNHGAAELAYVEVQSLGGQQLLTPHDNFAKPYGSFAVHHNNKLDRRWSLVANGNIREGGGIC